MSLLSYEEALALVLEAVPAPELEVISTHDACGRVNGEPVLSPLDLPLFDNSSMDGYAVRTEDVRRASRNDPVDLELVATIAAGQCWDGEVTAGKCARVSTGSALPQGADAVVMQEDTKPRISPQTHIQILEGPKPWENVRLKGELVKAGSTLCRTGEVMTPGTIALLAAAGVEKFKAARQPLLGIMATGSELMEVGTLLAPGKIYETNRIALANLAKPICGPAKILPIVQDELGATRLALENAFQSCDAVITCGGVSVGPMDFVKEAFTQIGGELQFWRVAIKPGRPFALGRLCNKLLFALPGNPVSAIVTFLLLVRPGLLKWQGAGRLQLPSSIGKLAEPLRNPGERRHFMRVIMDEGGTVRSAGVQASHALSSLSGSNGLLDMAPGLGLPAGALVPVLRWW